MYKFRNKSNSVAGILLISAIVAASVCFVAAIMFFMRNMELKGNEMSFVSGFFVIFLSMSLSGLAIYWIGTSKSEEVVNKAFQWQKSNSAIPGDIGVLKTRMSEEDYIKANILYASRKSSYYMQLLFFSLLSAALTYALIKNAVNRSGFNGTIATVFAVSLYYIYVYTLGLVSRSKKAFKKNQSARLEKVITITEDTVEESSGFAGGRTKKVYDIQVDDSQLLIFTKRNSFVCLNRSNFRDDAQFYYFIIKALGIVKKSQV